MIKYIILVLVAYLLLPWYILFPVLGLFVYSRIFRFHASAKHFDLYFGLPGSGKTTVLAEIARQNSKNKKVVTLCNVPITGTYEVSRDDLGKFDISSSAFGVDDVVILYDECSLDYFKRAYEDFSKRENTFHSMHRHVKVHEVFACQSWDGMDKRLRELNTRLYYVDRWYFNLIRIRRIEKDFTIDDETHKPTEGYEFVKFSSRFVYAPRVWHMFDSFDTSMLPKTPKKWKMWGCKD